MATVGVKGLNKMDKFKQSINQSISDSFVRSFVCLFIHSA